MKPGNRHDLEELARQRWDLVVLGGGINGAGTARDAAMRGLKVLLLEKGDFGGGCSSRSTKLAHGGLRYLETREFGLVRESLRERGLLLKVLAPHLVRPQPFLIPFYRGDARPPWLVRAGLWLYDALGWRSLIRPHRGLSAKAALEAEPGLNPEGLRGAALYWDCQMNDARLVLENVLDAERHGARCLNYASVLSAHSLRLGDVRLRVRDEEEGREAEIRAALALNAAGPWADEALRRLGRESPAPLLRPTKGAHLVTRPLTRGHALLIPARGDRRVFFVIPWRFGGREASLVGTTDTDFHGDLEHVRAEAEDTAYLAAEARRVLPQAAFGPADIWASYAGVRPLAAPPSGAAHNSQVSREAQVIESPGLLTMIGGKFTTYRGFAQGAVDRVFALFERPAPPCPTASPLPGAPRPGQPLPQPAELAAAHGISEASAAFLVSHYGLKAAAVAALGAEDEEWLKPLAPGSPALLAQAVFAARHEKLVRLEDFYLRRTFLGLELPPEHKGVDRVAAAVGRELRWSREREEEALEGLHKVLVGEFAIISS